MEASDIHAAVAQLRSMAAAIAAAKAGPEPEGLSTSEIIAHDQAVDDALTAWGAALADVVLDIYRGREEPEPD